MCFLAEHHRWQGRDTAPLSPATSSVDQGGAAFPTGSRAEAAWIQGLLLDRSSQVCLSDMFPNVGPHICHPRSVFDLVLGSWRGKDGKQALPTNVGFLLLKSRPVGLAVSNQHTSPRYLSWGLGREHVSRPFCALFHEYYLIFQFAATY